jgi:hypothetical protein
LFRRLFLEALEKAFLGNRYRKEKLARCRELLGMEQSADHQANPEMGADYRDKVEELTGISLQECPTCHHGHMLCIEVLERIAPSPPLTPDLS